MNRPTLTFFRALPACAVLLSLGVVCPAATVARAPRTATPQQTAANGALRPSAGATRSFYAAIEPLQEIAIFDPKTGAQTGTITSGIAYPFGIFLDRKELYVANAGEGSVPSTVTVYASGQSNPVQTYDIPAAESARGVIVRGKSVYVLVQDRSGSVCHILIRIYNGSNVNPVGELALPQYAGCFTPSITLSSNDSIYVGYIQGTTGSGSISGYSVFAPKTHKPVDVALPNFRYGNLGLAADAQGNVLMTGCVVGSSGVCTGDGADDVWYFPAGQTAPTEDFTPGYGTASALTFGPKEASFYVGDVYGAAFYQYSYPSGQYVGAIPGTNYENRGMAEGKGP